jgi:hypothetical protein
LLTLLLLLPAVVASALPLPLVVNALLELKVFTSAVALELVLGVVAMLPLLAVSANAGPVGIAGLRLADLPTVSLLLMPLVLLLLASPDVQLITLPAGADDGIPGAAA